MSGRRQQQPWSAVDADGSGAVQRAYNKLKDRILDGSMPYHARYLEADLVQELDVSRTPIREACIRLQGEGLVEVVPRRGVRIVPISVEDLADLYDLIATLEARAAQLAAERELAPEELSGLYQAVDRMDQAVADGELSEWAAADGDFHRRLAEASGNRHLVRTLAGFADRVHRARQATLGLRETPVGSNRDHRQLVDVIAAGQPAEAHDLHLTHRRQTALLLIGLMTTHGLTEL